MTEGAARAALAARGFELQGSDPRWFITRTDPRWFHVDVVDLREVKIFITGFDAAQPDEPDYGPGAGWVRRAGSGAMA